MFASDRKAPAIVLGNGVTALTTVQDLGRNGVPVYLVGSNKSDIAYHSRYATPIELADINDPQQLLLCLKEITTPLGQKPVLLCCTDHFLEIISAVRDEIMAYCHLNLPSKTAVATVLDKGLFGDFCAAQNLPAPRSWSLATRKCLDECSTAARYPVAIKPLFSHKSKGENFLDNGRYAAMILANDAVELRRIYEELSAHGANLVVQEYITGPDCEHYSYVSYRDSSCRELAAVGVRKIRVYPVHAGVGTFSEVTEDEDLATKANTVLDALRYKGISSVCFKRDANSGNLVLHEINGRFPQPHSTSRLCGVNLSYIAYQDALGERPVVERVSAGRKKWMLLRLDYHAFRQYRKLGEMSTMAWLKSLSRVRQCTEFALDDLRPFLFLLRDTFDKFWKRLSAKTESGAADSRATRARKSMQPVDRKGQIGPRA